MPTDLTARIAAGEADNAEVLTALGWYPNLCDGKPTGEWCNEDGYWGWPDKRPLPQPLTSVDDALRLVPEGWTTYQVTEFENRAHRWHWTLANRGVPFDEHGTFLGFGKAPTAARALTIAILKTKENPDERR